ncbi:MAG: hypothetical protein KJO82_03050, partial [Gammaproteobacteria bacterium]|nr:hypothetical protein [Gammaproteobacteria bacterium]
NPISVELEIVDDGTVEGNEFIELALGSPVGATIGQASTLQISILDGTGSNRAPNSVAGGGQVVSGGSTVTLNGDSSNDPDGDTLTYQWTQLLGQSVAINNATSARATFVAPNVSSDTVLQFQLQVFDPAGLNDVSTTNVTVRASTGNSGGNEGGGGGGVLLHLLALLLAVTAMRRGRFTRTDAA